MAVGFPVVQAVLTLHFLISRLDFTQEGMTFVVRGKNSSGRSSEMETGCTSLTVAEANSHSHQQLIGSIKIPCKTNE